MIHPALILLSVAAHMSKRANEGQRGVSEEKSKCNLIRWVTPSDNKNVLSLTTFACMHCGFW